MRNLWSDWKAFMSIRAAKKKRPQKAGLQLFHAADGTLLLFPCAWIYVLPEPVILPPPYIHEMVGRMILDMADKWFDPPKPDGPPEKKFWTAVPQCRSYRSFHRGHQLIGIEVEKKPGLLEAALAYMPRKSDGSYGAYNGEVVISCRISQYGSESGKKLAHRIGGAVWQIFRLAEVADPLPPSASKPKNNNQS